MQVAELLLKKDSMSLMQSGAESGANSSFVIFHSKIFLLLAMNACILISAHRALFLCRLDDFRFVYP